MAELSDATVVVTGASTGIGRETAITFGERGASVVLGDVDVDGTEETADAVEAAGGEATVLEVDVTDEAAVESMVDAAVESYGGLDCAFNNAGISGEQAPVAELSADGWGAVLDVNLTGVFHGVKHQVDAMLDDGGGAIVNNASVLGQVGFEDAAAYTAAKHGVIGLTRAAALEYSSQGVRVNAVCPGFVDTPMLAREGITTDEELRAGIEALHPIGRLGESEEIADAVVWLCSDDASFVTGHAMNVDGGYLSR